MKVNEAGHGGIIAKCYTLVMKSRFLIGIDEVGRGPIAGPVAVGAFVFLKKDSSKLFKSVKESKQLSEAKREEWFKKILEIQKNGDIDFAVT